MLNPVLNRLSATPELWNRLRWLVEAGFTGEHLAIARELRPWRGDHRRFLDLGCGTGEFAADFPPHRYVGIDPSLTYLRFAVNAGRERTLPLAAMRCHSLIRRLTPASFLAYYTICPTPLPAL